MSKYFSSRYIDLKKDRHDFAKQIHLAFKWNKKKKEREKKTQFFLEDAAEHAVYRGSWIKYSSESIRAEAEDTPLPPLWSMGIVIRFREETTRVPPQSNMHLTFMNLSDPLNFYPRLEAEERLLAGISIVALVV